MGMKQKVNYKSSFDFILELHDRSGRNLGMPSYDWEAVFFTASPLNTFRAGRFGGKCFNCFDDDGNIHIVAKGHKLHKGVLNVEFTAFLPDEIYPDGVRDVMDPEELDIELVEGKGDCANDLKAVVTLPVLGGLTRSDVEALLAKKQDKRELPFGFMKDYRVEVWAEEHPDGVWFSRQDGAFYRNGELAEAGDGCYNEVTEDGTVRANTRMVFRCNDTRYRFTGRELVNLDWATGGAMRRVCRVPSLNAHPGLFYLDRGYIAVHAENAPCRISLKGLYWMDEIGAISSPPIPLSVFDVTTNYRHQDYGCKAHIEGDELVVEESLESGKGNWIHLLVGTDGDCRMLPDTVIGVCLRPDGGKVFYRTSAAHLAHLTLPVPHASSLLSLLATEVSTSGKYSFKIALRDISSSHKVQYEVWQRGRHRMGSYELKRKKRIWRWKSLTFRGKGGPATKVVRGNRALIRMRIRHKGVWTEWAYFHVRFRPLENGKVDVTVRRSQPMRLAGTRICSLTEADIDAMFKR